MKNIILIILLFISTPVWAATHYVRTDGGTGSQCDGLTDHALSGASGTNCAVNHPNWIFPPRSEDATRAAGSGDTVVIHGPESGTGIYRLGCQGTVNCRDSSVNLTSSAFCAAAFPYDCYAGTVPDSVLVVGCSATGCSGGTVPILWGAGGIGQVLNISSSSSVILQDLEITDHAACGHGNSFSCGSGVDDLSAVDGINQIGATSPYYKNLYIHGMNRYGIYGGSVSNPTFDHVNLDKNAYGGINFDSCNDSSCGSTGTLLFNFLTITFAGCIEDYPVDGTKNGPTGITQCYDQNDSGYGDALGTNVSGGNWYFYNSTVSHNASDAVDLLYHDNTGTVLLSRYTAEGNTGTQFKSAAHTNYVENSKLAGNCKYFVTAGVSLGSHFSTCRNSGDVVQLSPGLGQTNVFTNTSVWGQDGSLIDNGNNGGANTCNGTETLTVKNSIFFGEPREDGGGTNSGWFYCSGSDGNGAGNCCTGGTTLVPSITYSNVWNTKDAPVSGTGNINQNPKWNQGDDMSPEPNTDSFDMTLKSSSPSRDIGNNSATFQNLSNDLYNFSRSGTYDQGAFEYGSASTCVAASSFCIDGADCCSGTCSSSLCTSVSQGNYKFNGKIRVNGKVRF